MASQLQAETNGGVMDLSGKTVFSKENLTLDHHYTIDMSDKQAGVYHVIIVTKNNKQVLKYILLD